MPAWQLVVGKQKAWPGWFWYEVGAVQREQLRSLVAVGATAWNWPTGQVAQARQPVSVEPWQAESWKEPALQLLQGTQRVAPETDCIKVLAGHVETQALPTRKLGAVQDRQLVALPAQEPQNEAQL